MRHIRLRDAERDVAPAAGDFARNMARLDRLISELDREKLRLLEQYHSGGLTADGFRARKSKLDERKRLLAAEREQVEEVCRAEQRRAERLDAEQQRARRFLVGENAGRDEVLRGMYEAIDRVLVIDDKHLNVRWRFDDCFEQLAEMEK